MRNVTRHLLLASLALAAVAAQAQQPGPHPALDELKKLEFLVGKAVSKMKVTPPNQSPQDVELMREAHWTAGGWHLQMEQTVKSGGQSLEVLWVISYDLRLKQYRIMGYVPENSSPMEGTGHFDGKNLIFKLTPPGGPGGIGVDLAPTAKDGYTAVNHVTEGLPAARAGIRRGDLIKAIDGKSAKGLSTAEIARGTLGAVGTNVRITFSRAGKEREVKLKREVVVADQTTFVPKPGHGYSVLHPNRGADLLSEEKYQIEP